MLWVKCLVIILGIVGAQGYNVPNTSTTLPDLSGLSSSDTNIKVSSFFFSNVTLSLHIFRKYVYVFVSDSNKKAKMS